MSRAGVWAGFAFIAMLSSAVAGGPDRFDTVVVDAGHGGDDRGAVGLRGVVEKDLVLDVAERLAARLRGHGLRVVMTRQRDVWVPLEERYAIANDARGDLFVSIHANATGNPEVRGVETFFLSLRASDADAGRVAERENGAFQGDAVPARASDDPLIAILGDLISTEHLEESNEFARLAQSELAVAAPGGSRGVKQAPFVVLQGVQMPASLVEIGFVTNAADASDLRSERGRERVADALARATQAFGRRYEARHGARAGRP